MTNEPLTQHDRLKIIEEQLRELQKRPATTGMQDTIRNIRTLTYNIWEENEWNESSIDC